MINLYHLRYFVDAANSGGISGAARLNLVSQSAVSQAIRSLELQLEASLILHQRNRFHLTTAGKELVKQSEAIFHSVTKLQRSLGPQEKSTELVIGTSLSLGLGSLPSAISAYSRKSKVKIRLQVGNSETLRGWIKTGQTDLAIFVDDRQRPRDFIHTEIAQGHFVVFKNSKVVSDIKEGITITRQSRPEVKKLRSLYRRRHRGDLPIASEIISWEVIKSYVMKVGGYGFVPDYVIREELKTGALTVNVPLSRQIEYAVIAVTSALSEKHILAKSFTEHYKRWIGCEAGGSRL